MSVSKWIGGALGWSFGGPIGAIIGVALGSMVDSMIKGNETPFLGQGDYNKRKSKKTRTKTRQTKQRPQTQSGDFEVSLLILASIVIKADGVQDQRELDYVREQFTNMYGKERANNAFKLFKNINKQKNISKRQVCLQIKQMMDHPSRLQLVHFLFGVAKADGMVTQDEERQIFTMSGYLGISSKDYESIKSMFFNSSDNAYRILEISKGASVDDIKRAYRKMAKKYHPDRVQHLGKEHQKGAEDKFRQVQEAYELLQEELGF